MTSIEWTDATWNPIVGCSRVSPGCEHCYAERFVHRGLSAQHRGLTVMRNHGPGWTGEVRLVKERLAAPLSWRKPRRIFVNSLSDLFHEKLSNEDIAAVFGVMAACPHLTFQVLTKRPARMREWFRWIADVGPSRHENGAARGVRWFLWNVPGHDDAMRGDRSAWRWPLPNVWLGVTVEDQERADRIVDLSATPAALRFVSVEPMLGPVTLGLLGILPSVDTGGAYVAVHQRIGWVIVGGESGPGARPFHASWMRSVVDECRDAEVPVFCKQLGANVHTRNDDNFTIDEDPPDPDFPPWPPHLVNEDRVGPSERYQGAPVRLRLRDRKGGDMSEWRADLRVREFPGSGAR